MKNIIKVLATSVVLTVLVGCQTMPSMTAPATDQPDITGTDVI